MLGDRAVAAHAAHRERRRLDEPGEWRAVTASFLSATGYGVGGMVRRRPEILDALLRPGGFAAETRASTVHELLPRRTAR